MTRDEKGRYTAAPDVATTVNQRYDEEVNATLYALRPYRPDLNPDADPIPPGFVGYATHLITRTALSSVAANRDAGLSDVQALERLEQAWHNLDRTAARITHRHELRNRP